MKRKSSTILRRTIPVTKVSMVSMATRTDAFDKFMTEATSMGQVIVPTLGIKMKSKDIISRRTNEWMNEILPEYNSWAQGYAHILPDWV